MWWIPQMKLLWWLLIGNFMMRNKFSRRCTKLETKMPPSWPTSRRASWTPCRSPQNWHHATTPGSPHQASRTCQVPRLLGSDNAEQGQGQEIQGLWWKARGVQQGQVVGGEDCYIIMSTVWPGWPLEKRMPPCPRTRKRRTKREKSIGGDDHAGRGLGDLSSWPRWRRSQCERDDDGAPGECREHRTGKRPWTR